MAKGFITLPVGYQRVDAEPLTNDQVFQSLEEAQAFANGTSDKGDIAYPGQLLSIKESSGMALYVVQQDKSLLKLETSIPNRESMVYYTESAKPEAADPLELTSSIVKRPGGGTVEEALAALGNGEALRPLYIACGAVYNEETGFYELNGLTDITEEEMLEIYAYTGTFGVGDNYPGIAAGSKIRTNFFIPNTFYTSSYGNLKNMQGMFRECQKLEVCKIAAGMGTSMLIKNMSTAFESSRRLRKIIGIMDVTNCTSFTFAINAVSLVDFRIKGLHTSMNIESLVSMSIDSLKYLVENAINTNAITVTVHPDVLAKLQDEEGHPDWYAVNTAAQGKQISFATV